MMGLTTIKHSPWKQDTLARAVLNLRSIPGTSQYRRFVIVGTARTGSTLLVDLLKSHSQVRVFGELFRSTDEIGWDVKPFASFQSPEIVSLYRRDPVTFLQSHVFRRWPRTCKAVGFKLFYYHARTPEHAVVWDYLAADPDICVIHLRRRNLLAQYYSLRLAHQTNSWTKSAMKKTDSESLVLDAQECSDHFGWVRALEEECIAFFARREVHDVWYEDLVANKEGTMGDIQNFLGLEHKRVSATVARQRTKPLRLSIANYDSLRRDLEDTPWAVFFESDAQSGDGQRQG